MNITARERELNSQRIKQGNVLFIQIYFKNKKFDIEDNGLNTPLEDIDYYIESGLNDSLVDNEVVWDGNQVGD
jgi:hypothetical protein